MLSYIHAPDLVKDEAWAERDALKRDSEAQKSVTMTRDRLESTETQQLGVECIYYINYKFNLTLKLCVL